MSALRKWPWRAVAAMVAVVLLLSGAAIWLFVRESQMESAKVSVVLEQAAQGLDEIHIEAELDAENHSMMVHQTLLLTSRTAEDRDQVVLRTWPNAFQKPDTSPVSGNSQLCPEGFSAGSLAIAGIQLERNGQMQEISHRYLDEAKTVLSLPLDVPWQPGETLCISMVYTVHFPHIQYRFGWWDDAFMAGQAFAVPALWQEGACRTDAYLPIGDPLSGECANYQLQIRVPNGYTCAATGLLADMSKTDDGSTEYVFKALAARDLGLVMRPDQHRVTSMEDGVLVQAYAPNPSQARQLLKVAREALRCFSRLYGEYPYPTFAVCAVPMRISGAEYSSMAMVAESLQDAQELEYTVAHEVAHQWWYNLVGSDSSTHPWMDEALCEFSLLEYVEERYGKAAREALRQSRVETSMRVTVAGDATPGAPLEYFETNTDYMVLVYGRATSLLCALDDWMEGKLGDILGQYAKIFAFAMPDRQEFTRLLQQEAGMDVEPLMIDYLDTYLIN